MVHLRKSGCKKIVSTYPGIAKLSAIPRLFEAIIDRQLTYNFKNCFSPTQHGFLTGKYATTTLLEFVIQILQNLRSHNQTYVIFTDFSKAFDKVDHNLLLLKLSELGLPYRLIE